MWWQTVEVPRFKKAKAGRRSRWLVRGVCWMCEKRQENHLLFTVWVCILPLLCLRLLSTLIWQQYRSIFTFPYIWIEIELQRTFEKSPPYSPPMTHAPRCCCYWQLCPTNTRTRHQARKFNFYKHIIARRFPGAIFVFIIAKACQTWSMVLVVQIWARDAVVSKRSM